jgi:hypothetical protein
MNVFALDNNPRVAAKFHCDTHVVKMIVESAQMLSTAHRLLDGKKSRVSYVTKKGKHRTKDVWTLAKAWDSVYYKVAHPKHPSTVWTTLNAGNYSWHYELFCALCDEYTYRYGKIHKTDRLLRDALTRFPKNIIPGKRTPFALAMKSNPECMDPTNPIESYRAFYRTKQSRFKMVWTGRNVPSWFNVSYIVHKAA